MRKSSAAAGLVSLLALVFVAAGCGTPAAPVAESGPEFHPNMVITPSSGALASKVAILGSGFAPEEEIKLSMTVLESVEWAFGTEKGKITTNKDGAFAVAATMPARGLDADQAYTIKAEGLKSGVKASYPFLVIKKK